jgi:acyl-CoA thioesterase
MYGGPSERDAFSTFLGLRFDSAAVVRLEIRTELINGVGKLLGPVVFALADYGMGAAVWDTLSDGQVCATVNVAINFVDSAASGEVVCTSRVDRRTRRAAATSCEIRHADGRLLATALGSFAVILGRTAPAPPA